MKLAKRLLACLHLFANNQKRFLEHWQTHPIEERGRLWSERTEEEEESITRFTLEELDAIAQTWRITWRKHVPYIAPPPKIKRHNRINFNPKKSDRKK